jgi:hypothetical protein
VLVVAGFVDIVVVTVGAVVSNAVDRTALPLGSRLENFGTALATPPGTRHHKRKGIGKLGSL